MGLLTTVFSTENDRFLLQGVEAGSYSRVEAALQANFNGFHTMISQNGMNEALWLAAAMGNARISNLLEEYGGEKQAERNGRLACAAQTGNCAEIEKLLDVRDGAKVGNNHNYALRMAIIHNQPEAVGLLCVRGADLKEVLYFADVTNQLKFGGPSYAGMRGFIGRKLGEMPQAITPEAAA